MRLGILFSGGKDSTLALRKAMDKGKVKCLLTMVSKNPASYMFHVPNIDITELQSQALGVPIIKKTTQGMKEKELEDLKQLIEKAIEEYEIDGICTGAVKSVYQKSRIEKICDELKIKCFNPLWGLDEIKILRETLEKGFRTIISGVFALGFDESWLGREIDEKTIKQLELFNRKYGISPAGEGGEFETTVLDAPFFKKRINILDFEKKWERNSGVFVIKKAKLIEKK